MTKKLCIFMCMILFASVVTYSVFGATVDDLYNQKGNLTEQINDARNELNYTEGVMSDVQQQINGLNEKIAQYQQEITELKAKLGQVTIDVDVAKKRLVAAQERYIKQKNLLEQRLVAMYEAGETMYLDVLLASRGLEDFLSKYYFLSEITKYDIDLLENVEREKQNIETEKIKLENQQQQLKALSNNAERTAVTLENTRTLRSSYLSKLTVQEKALQEKISQYEKDIESINNQILYIGMLSINENYAGGEMAWPVPGYRTITSGYGMRNHPIFGVWSMHTGTDIGAPMGVDVIAVNDGIVSVTGYTGALRKLCNSRSRRRCYNIVCTCIDNNL